MQEQDLPGFSGLVWFRKTIDIPAGWAGKDLILNLGVIDDNDFTYFNGIQIGHTEGWMAPRSYKIPKELVKKGKAVIAVRVMDTGGTVVSMEVLKVFHFIFPIQKLSSWLVIGNIRFL